MWDAFREVCFRNKKKEIKTFINKPNMGTRVEKTVHELDTRWLSNKEKVLGTTACKEWHVDSLLGLEGKHYLISLKKGTTLNSPSYCQLLGQDSPYLLNDSYIPKEDVDEKVSNVFWYLSQFVHCILTE